MQVLLRRRTLTLFDFIAPSLLHRKFSSAPKKTPSVQSNSIFDKLREQLIVHEHNILDSRANAFNDALVKFRRALKEKDVVALVQHWQGLKQNKLLHLVRQPHTDTETLSVLLAQYLSLAPNPQLYLSDSEVIEEMALHAASGRRTDALNACMLLNLKKGKSENVIRLYDRFMASLEEKELWDESLEDEEGTLSDTPMLAPDTKMIRRPIPHNPGRVKILLAVVTAHAMQDSFSAALQTCLATVVLFQDYTTKQFLENLTDDLVLKQKVKMYVERLHIARMVARPPSLSKHIINISTAPNTRMLEKLYQAIIDGLTGPDAYLAVDPSVITPSRSVALTEVGWTSFLTAFLRSRRRDLAANLWNDMNRLNVKPGVSVWTALLDAYDDMRAVDDAIAAWNMMLSEGIKPDSLAYRAFISALFNGRRPEDAMKTFQNFQSESTYDGSSPQTLAVCNTVLHGLLYANRLQEADVVLQNMHANGPKPDVTSYNTLLTYHGRRCNFKALANIINTMASNKLVGDVYSYSIILSALLKAGREDAPELLLSIMRKQGVQPNVAIFSTIIDHQMREGTEQNLRAAMRLLHEMEQDDSTKPNEITYASILTGLYRGSWLSVESAEEWRKEITKRMERDGLDLTLPTYHILIRACLEYPHPEGLQHALGYYREMARRRVPLVQTTWYILLAGLLQRGEWGVGNEIISDMFMSGIQPRGSLLQLVGKIRKRTV